MNKIGMLIYRSTLILFIAVLALAVPTGTANAAFANEDFNTCSLSTAWIDETGSHANPALTGANTENAALTLVVAPGAQSTMSGSGLNASRVMQPMDDANFEVEVRFNNTLPTTSSTSNYRMQGLLIRDSSGSTTKWLRFDLNVDNDNIGYYVAYIEGTTATGITPTTASGNIGNISMNATDFSTPGTALRIRYTQATGEWAVRWYLPSVGAWDSYKTFTEAGKGFTFNVTHIGLWAGSTGPQPPGHTVNFDYFWNGTVDEAAEDALFICSEDLTEKFYLPMVGRQ